MMKSTISLSWCHYHGVLGQAITLLGTRAYELVIVTCV